MVVVGESTENDELICVNQKNNWDDEADEKKQRVGSSVTTTRTEKSDLWCVTRRMKVV